jgi:hypothetical protein
MIFLYFFVLQTFLILTASILLLNSRIFSTTYEAFRFYDLILTKQ